MGGAANSPQCGCAVYFTVVDVRKRRVSAVELFHPGNDHYLLRPMVKKLAASGDNKKRIKSLSSNASN